MLFVMRTSVEMPSDAFFESMSGWGVRQRVLPRTRQHWIALALAQREQWRLEEWWQ
jgi:hypothetical protein